MSKQKFEFLDLLFLSILSIATEVIFTLAFNAVNVKVGNNTLGQILTLSFSALIGMIAIYRWNQFGLVVAPLGGIASLITRMVFKQQLSVQLWLYYSVSYLGLISCFLFIRKKDKTKFRKDIGMMILYYFIGFLSVEVVRAIVLIGSENYWTLTLNLLSYDLINVFVSFLIYLVTLKQEGLVVDMNQYLVDMKNIQTKIKNKDDICYEELAEGNQINEAAILDGGTLSTEDLKKMEDERRKIEGRHTAFDEENEQLMAYKKKREALKNGKK